MIVAPGNVMGGYGEGKEFVRLCQEAGVVKNRDEMRDLSADLQEEMQWRATKRIAELLLLALQNGRTKYVAVRFGNVLG